MNSYRAAFLVLVAALAGLAFFGVKVAHETYGVPTPKAVAVAAGGVLIATKLPMKVLVPALAVGGYVLAKKAGVA